MVILDTLLPGQVRSECLMCTFRTSCCSTCLSQSQVPAFAGSSVQDQKKGGDGSKRGQPALVGTTSPTRVGSRRRVVRGVMEVGMSRRVTPKRN